MTDFFKVACDITRKHVAALEEFPMLNPSEHRFAEELAGRELSNREAQILIREAATEAAFEHYASGKKAD